jgi:hypothetical protein
MRIRSARNTVRNHSEQKDARKKNFLVKKHLMLKNSENLSHKKIPFVKSSKEHFTQKKWTKVAPKNHVLFFLYIEYLGCLL